MTIPVDAVAAILAAFLAVLEALGKLISLVQAQA